MPATRSPSRLPREFTSEVTRAGTPQNTQISTTPTSARMNAWWKEIGPASSRTVRVPTAYFPTLLPRVKVSRVHGTTTRAPANATMLPTAYSASSVASIPTVMTPTRSSPASMVTSISPESSRVPREAGGSSRVTASPVTRSSVSSPA